MRLWLAALALAAATPVRAQCYYSDFEDQPRPAPCPETAKFPDRLPPPPPGTLWLPAPNRPHVYKAEMLMRKGPDGIAFEGTDLEGASLPAIQVHPDGRLTPTRWPDGERSDGGSEIKAPGFPGNRFCEYAFLTENEGDGNYYSVNRSMCPEDHAIRGLSTPPPGRTWMRLGPKRGEMHLVRFVVPTATLGRGRLSAAAPPAAPLGGPPDHPPGPVPLLRSAAEPAPVAQAETAREYTPAVAPQPRPAPDAAPAAPRAEPQVGYLPFAGVVLLFAAAGAAFYFTRRKAASKPAFSASWTRSSTPQDGATSAQTAAATVFGPGTQAPSTPTWPVEAMPTPLPPGARLNGRYEVKRKIGEGGMGVVLEAFDHQLGRRVAIKVMRPEIAHGEGARETFLAEAKIISHLSHPYIVSIHEVVENADGVYLVFDYVDGQPLSSVLKTRGRLPLDECIAVYTHVCEAIASAHRARVLHRDLKPSNIMIDSAGYAKVMDFGIAREAKETITRMTNLDNAGTPAYMAPEQHLGRCAKASDIYALGVCLYQTLTGSLPFQGPDFLVQKERMKFAPPQFLAPDLPKGAEILFATALAADPKLRVADAAELLESLKSLRR